MSKKMLIDDTQPEETRVVIVDGNKVEDLEFESTSRKQIKGNIYTAKVVRIEPSLQAAFIDYGSNKHGFLAFSEIHPDYYYISDELSAAIDKEVDEIIENKKAYIKQRREERARYRAEKKAAYEARKLAEQQEAAQKLQEEQSEQETLPEQEEPVEQTPQNMPEGLSDTQNIPEEENAFTDPRKKRRYIRRNKKAAKEVNGTEELKVLSAEIEDDDDDVIVQSPSNEKEGYNDDDIEIDITPEASEAEFEYAFEVQRKLIRARKLYHNSSIQDVIREGQVLLVQVVKEERGNKGASFTTYLSLAGRYGVLMPNRIKSGGVSRKITDAADRKRLKDIIKDLPLPMNMSLIIRTAGEDKSEEEIVRDYNYLIRTWNLIRTNALKNSAPTLIYEEGDLIKRALRDMCTSDISEIIVDGDKAFKAAHDFVKILSPQNLRKLKCRKPYEPPVFQRYQIEAQLDKLHSPSVQLESGGYLVINPTEALVAIDVNSGRATKEMDIEETALKTNMEAADEIARQLKMRDLAGLIVVDFIDMDDPKNNIAVEKRMKEALKNDRARVQVARMSCFGLLEISRQRMHSSFMESNYEPCPYCKGHGVMRTIESGAVLILRALEEEGIKNKFSSLSVVVPTDTALYLLNHKRKNLLELEERYNLSITIAADSAIKNVSDYKIERQRIQKPSETEPEVALMTAFDESCQSEEDLLYAEETSEQNPSDKRGNKKFLRKRGRFDRRYGKDKRYKKDHTEQKTPSNVTQDQNPEKKKAWWRRLIG